jgi:tetratricopeptide (TPR) repeat protein
MDAFAISSKLGVAHVVEGSLRRQGNRLRISVQLIEGQSGLALWSDTFDRGARELLSVQQILTEEIVRRVLPEAEAVETAPATRDADANELMLLAHYYEQQVRSRQEVDTDKLLQAIRLYREAVEADPDSALAHSRLAGALLYLGDIEAAEAPIFKALSLDPRLSDVQNTLGEFYWARGLPEADTAFKRAVELNPNNVDALHNYASLIWRSIEGQQPGSPDPGQMLRRALELDPLSLDRYAAMGEYLAKDGQWDEVPAIIEAIEGLFDDAESYRVVAWLHELAGELDRAIAWTLRARDLEPDNVDHMANLAQLFVAMGDIETANRLEPRPSVGLLFQMRRYEELIDVAEFLMIEEPNNADVRYLLAFAYVATNRFEAAIHVLGSTGLPDTILNDQARSVAEIEAFMTLINALAGSGIPDAAEAARSLAQFQEKVPWWGEVGWIGLFKSCNLAALGQYEEALSVLPLIKESRRLRRDPLIHDSWCFRPFAEEPVYQDVLRDQDERKARLREKLPATLAEFGVEL